MNQFTRAWLAPFVPLYKLGLALRERRLASGREVEWELEWPVVSIGNLSTGGTGKTPLTIALARALTARGFHVDVLSRGYGRSSSDTELVQQQGSAQHFGDEPMLIAREAGVPVYVDAERYEAGLLAESEQTPDGPAVHLLDDGFQHRQLYRNVDILLLDEHDWRDQLLPAGNLREERNAIKRADVVAIPSDQSALEAALRSWGWDGPIWKLHRHMNVPVTDGPTVAFCGIARPEQFFSGLEAAGVQVAERIPFPDHHAYTQSDLQKLRTALESTRASTLLTTEKDAVRLGKMVNDLSLKSVPLRTEIENESAAIDWLIGKIQSGEADRPL
jgi:tetraacyldisaccharide 4'-kinase